MHLGKSLEIALIKCDMKKGSLADHMGVVPQQVSQWIRTGSIRWSTLKEICNLLEMPVSEFIKLGE